MSELSDIPSEFINQAVCDLEKIEKNREYKVDMYTWHSSFKGVCHVCLAGAVMACSLKVNRYDPKNPYLFDSASVRGKLVALDILRAADILSALRILGVEDGIARPIHEKYWVNWVSYDRDPTGFKEQLREVAARLKEKGL